VVPKMERLFIREILERQALFLFNLYKFTVNSNGR
jgi:hypothetical protein